MNSDSLESAVYHFDREHQQLDPDRLCHWERQLPICGGTESASNAGI